MAANTTDKEKNTSGHRQRLRDRFVAGEAGVHTDEALLELLLTYAIPQQDVQPLARKLITTFGSLSGVLSADLEGLCKVEGVKANSAVLLKLVDWIKTSYTGEGNISASVNQGNGMQLNLFESSTSEETASQKPEKTSGKAQRGLPAQNQARMFWPPRLKEAIELLPRLPETDSLEEVRAFLRNSLYLNAQETRQRAAEYITQRMFPFGKADYALRAFARAYAERQELRDACFYRFCIVEPLALDIMNELLLPAIGAGRLERSRLRAYLTQRFPASKNVNGGVNAAVSALSAAGIVNADRLKITFAYRDILLPSFAFILHSEFSTPGIYRIEDVEQNRNIRALLWNPDRILPALYELRNRGIISKVSEIDTVRQFTTRLTLDQMVDELAAEGTLA